MLARDHKTKNAAAIERGGETLRDGTTKPPESQASARGRAELISITNSGTSSTAAGNSAIFAEILWIPAICDYCKFAGLEQPGKCKGNSREKQRPWPSLANC